MRPYPRTANIRVNISTHKWHDATNIPESPLYHLIIGLDFQYLEVVSSRVNQSKGVARAMSYLRAVINNRTIAVADRYIIIALAGMSCAIIRAAIFIHTAVNNPFDLPCNVRMTGYAEIVGNVQAALADVTR